MKKKCSKCGLEKPLEEFRNDKYRKSGKTSRCKKCLATFTPKEIRCYFCHEWFTQTQSTYKFCSPKCHGNYWAKVCNLGMKRYFYMREYNKNYHRTDRERKNA
jgi:hypothetical protein